MILGLPHTRRADLIAAGMALLAGMGLFLCFHDHGFDDPYITYRYALNLASGNGFVYNIGSAVLSTTAPLYALLLTPIAALGIDLPLASNVISCLSLAAGGLAFWRLGRAWEEPLAGLTAAALYPALPILVSTLGAETSFALALVLWSFVAAAADRWKIVATLLGLATIVRADTGLVGLVLGVGFLISRRQQRPIWKEVPWGAAAIYALLVAPWLLFAQAYFGSPIPATLAAKQHQIHIVGSRSFGIGLLKQMESLWATPTYRLMLILALIGVSYSLFRRRSALYLLGWNALYGLAYTLLSVSGYFWYYSPLYVGVVAATGLGVAGIAVGLQRFMSMRVASALSLGLGCVVFAGEINELSNLAARPDPRLVVYREVGKWLQAHTPVEATIGTLEVGIIGYYSQRTMIDFAGLIQPEVAAQFSAQHGYLESARWATKHYKPNYLVLQGALPMLSATPDIAARCVSVGEFSDVSYPDRMLIYQCNWDGE